MTSSFWMARQRQPGLPSPFFGGISAPNPPALRYNPDGNWAPLEGISTQEEEQ
jgi:hypothetical protein